MHRLRIPCALITLALGGCASSARKAAPLIPPPAPPPQAVDSTRWNLMRRVVPGETELNPERMAAGIAALRALPRRSVQRSALAASQPWTNLGPGNVGGRIRSLLIHPGNPDILFAGSVSGGVWRTTDGGASWSPLTDGLPNLIVGALAMDPTNPDVIYAGGGEQFDSRPGVGIYKTTDGGNTWQLLPAANFPYVNRIVVSPNNSQQIYVATRNGISSTKDGGASWTSTTLNATYYGCVDLAIRSDTKTDYLFAVCSGANSTTTFSVYRNMDAAGSGAWTAVHTAPNMGRSVIALAPSRQSTICVAAAGLGNPASPRDGVGSAGVFRSGTNGDPGTWVTQTPATGANPWNFLLFSPACQQP